MPKNARSLLTVVLALGALGIAQLSHGQSAQLAKVGMTSGRAQTITWLGDARFAVGRWDGTLTIFRPPQNQEYGPIMLQDATAPSLQGIQMMTALSSDAFVTSNDDRSIELWTGQNGTFKQTASLSFGPSLGIADTGTVFKWNENKWLVTGHEQGFIAIWRVDNSVPTFVRSVSLRSSNPIPSPYRIWNIRGVAYWKDGIIATGGEDGDLTLTRISDGAVVTRIRYNPNAQRGINAISVDADYLLVANCSVGATDKNLWLYRIGPSQITPLSSVNLEQNHSLPQVFDFSAQLARIGGTLYFLASTQEGLLWLGTVDKDQMKVSASTVVAPDGGAAFEARSDGEIAAAALDIELFKIQPNPSGAVVPH
jgi:hypothetical protein